MLTEAEADLEALLADPKIVEATKLRDGLKTSLDAWVIEKAADGSYEDDEWKGTRVQSHSRKWNAAKLEAIIGRSRFRQVIKIAVDPQKVDEAVRAKQIDKKKIAPAFEETPNKPYVKWTPVKDSTDRAEGEAAKLAEQLG